jgi:hypothetical protein
MSVEPLVGRAILLRRGRPDPYLPNRYLILVSAKRIRDFIYGAFVTSPTPT